jgi:hypothetical protein
MRAYRSIFCSAVLTAAAFLLPVSQAQAVPQPNTALTVDTSSPTVTLGGSIDVTITVFDTDVTPHPLVTCGNGGIQYNIDNTTWVDLANGSISGAGTFTATFDTTAFPALVVGDTIAFRGKYTAPGSGCSFKPVGPGQSPTTSVTVVAPSVTTCPAGQTTGVYISIEGPNGVGNPKPGYSGSWTFEVHVLACEDVQSVSAQGGANGWAAFSGASPSEGSVTLYTKNRNTVMYWAIGDMPKGDEEVLIVTVTGSIKNSSGECGKVKYLNGDWSALYKSVSTGGVITKSAYTTNNSAITVTCP